MKNKYYIKFIGESKAGGRWNVIQLLNGQARYFVLKGTLNMPHPLPFLSHGWIEVGKNELWFTDGEDYTDIRDWEEHLGIIINF